MVDFHRAFYLSVNEDMINRDALFLKQYGVLSTSHQ